ncbi:Phosphotransferase enzyme family protein [Tolypocladium paradoxum]|uniref:Phosphotransferase enzyme family protein n=1 Tax=Tolypocladium paradoxum TaxID=94208 RepID=A0A2S4KL99_9HYPO|nr:Phosphotransferase enzyme family protein [Tolypocladium paradoxum]
MAANGTHQPRIDISCLPDVSEPEMDFHDTSFFRSNLHNCPVPQLPTPASILEQYPNGGAYVAKFEHLNLAVKFGQSSYLRLEEAQAMRAMRQIFPNNEVPVPEVFGWRKHGDQTFIYMSLIRGPTLREAWPSLTEADKKAICGELRCIVAALRQITQGSSNRFIGSINGGTLQDCFFKLDYEQGPFWSMKSFNDWLFAAATRQRPDPDGVINGLYEDGLYRDLLPDTGNIYFTHGDLTLGNIIISGIPGSQRIVGIIDWEQAGWYPEYWEYCKLLYGVEDSHEWREDGWADKVMDSYDDEMDAFANYSSWRCP